MDKAERILLVFCRLLKHEWLNKTSLALEFNTTERTIERDMQSIRAVLSGSPQSGCAALNRQKAPHIPEPLSASPVAEHGGADHPENPAREPGTASR